MAKVKSFFKNHKRLCIISGIALVLIIAAVCVCLILFMQQDKSKGDDSDDKAKLENWDNLIADLEAEPVSELDELYKDKSSVKKNEYKIAVNKSQNYIAVYGKDNDDKYTKLVRVMICSVGFDTPVGSFNTSDKYSWKIVNGNVWAQYATRVVGNVLIHSMPYSEKDKGSLISGYYNQLGRTLSASCIRVSAADAEWIMKHCAKGTNVEIFESDEKEFERPVAIKVPDDATWDPTDPDKNNPWNSVVLEFKGLADVIDVERGAQFDYMQGVVITDTCGNDISSRVKVSTKMDVFTCGTYAATYSVEDATGKTAKKDVTFNVNDTTAPKLNGLRDTLYFGAVSAVTKESILDGVSVLDNNQVMSSSEVQVVIPAIVEGVNQVTLIVSDIYGNVMTTTINVVVDSKPPSVSLNSGVSKVIPLDQVVDRAYALSRIVATDDGQPIDESKITVSILPQHWGYSLKYKVVDEQKNVTTFEDEVSYVEYQIIPSGNLVVTDIQDKNQLLKNVVLRTKEGVVVPTDKVICNVNEMSAGKYQVTYSYTYSCPLGSKTVTAKDVFEIKIPATPTPVIIITPEPQETNEPQSSENPVETTTPDVDETPAP